MTQEESGKKKTTKRSKKKEETPSAGEVTSKIQTSEELRNFLLGVRDRLGDGSAATVYAVTAMNHVLSLPTIYDLLDKESKELARDVWLRIRQQGVQLKNPPLLFSEEEENIGTPA